MSYKLKPCPFCGGQAKLVGGPEEWKPSFYDPDSGGDPYFIYCDCGCQMEIGYDSQELIEAWNRRADQEWISVKDRLPENDYGKHWKDRKQYLVRVAPSGRMVTACYGFKEYGWWIDSNDLVLDKERYREVTHWRPLPEPPNNVGKKGR